MSKELQLYNLNKIDDKLKLPDSYKGKVYKNGGLTKFNPRKWTIEEINWVNMLKQKGLTTKQISECLDRDFTQVSIKLKRISKSEKTYNMKHVEDKYYQNDYFLSVINPKSVLDLYSGSSSYYEDKVAELWTNDINSDFGTYYSEKAEKLCAKLWYEGFKCDLIDLDPFGSAYDCFDLCIKMAKKGLIITFGELGHRRFKRLDYVSRYYGIQSMDENWLTCMIKEIQRIGLRNKKILIPEIVKDWNNIGRVYFKIIKQ
jgi:hypothetical protein